MSVLCIIAAFGIAAIEAADERAALQAAKRDAVAGVAIKE